MKYPFRDTPDNRTLEAALEAVLDPSWQRHATLGRYAIHFMPIPGLRIGDGEPFIERFAVAGVLGVIDRESGRHALVDLSAGSLRELRKYRWEPDHLESYLGKLETSATGELIERAMAEKDLGTLRMLVPEAFLIQPEPTCGDLIQTRSERHFSRDTSHWVLANFDTPLREARVPDELEPAVAQLLDQYAREELGARHTIHRSLDFGRFTLRNTDIGHQIRLLGPEAGEEHRDVRSSHERLHQSRVTLALDVPEAQVGEAHRRLVEQLREPIEPYVDAFRERYWASVEAVMNDLHQRRDAAVPEDQRRVNSGILAAIACQANWMFNDLVSDEPQVTRNRLQLLERLHGNLDAVGTWHAPSKAQRQTLLIALECFQTLQASPALRTAIDQGRPLKGEAAFADIPLLHTSKRRINDFLHNLMSMTASCCYALEPENRRNEWLSTVHMEKGPVRMAEDDDGGIATLAKGQRLHLAALLTSVPESCFFADGRRAYERARDQITTFSRLMDNMTEEVRRTRWGEDRPSLVTAYAWLSRYQDREQMSDANQALMDGAFMVSECYLKPVVQHVTYAVNGARERYSITGASIPMIDDVVEKYGYRALHTLADAAHRDVHHHYSAGIPAARVTWEPSLESPFAYGDYTITPLASGSALRDEGEAMNHCVASYLTAAMRGQSFLFSITRNTERVSTLELVDGGDEQVRVNQHRGPDNACPDEGADEAVEALVEAINRQRIAFNADPNVSREDMERLSKLEEEEVKSGLRFSDPVFIDRCLDRLHAWLDEPWIWVEKAFECVNADTREALDALRDSYAQRRQQSRETLFGVSLTDDIVPVFREPMD